MGVPNGARCSATPVSYGATYRKSYEANARMHDKISQRIILYADTVISAARESVARGDNQWKFLRRPYT